MNYSFVTLGLLRRFACPAKLLAMTAMAYAFMTLSFALPSYAISDSAQDVLDRIPVQHNGRVKPFASFARESALAVTGHFSYQGAGPTEVVWGWMAQPAIWSKKPLLPVGHPEIRKFFSSDLEANRISPERVLNDIHFLNQVLAAQARQSKKETLTSAERKKLELYNRARTFEEISRGAVPGFIPHPRDARARWLSIETILTKDGEDILRSFFANASVDTVRDSLGYLLLRMREGGIKMALPAAQNFASTLAALLTSRGIDLDRAVIDRELWYLKLHPFYLAWVLYFLSVFLWMVPKKRRGDHRPRRIAFGLYGLAFLLHTAGFLLRIWIAGRPPVTNMYESVIWVSWAVVFFSWLLFFFYGSLLIPATAACVAAFALMIGENLPAVLDASITPLVPVLRSNFWLTVHVMTITLGYGAFALNWGIAHVLLYRMAFSARKRKLIEDLTVYLYRSLQIGVIFLASGTVLGGVWASYSWGRFWGWDPKETWALIALLTYLAVLHGRIAGWLDQAGTAFWSAVSFLTVIMAWYGVNFVLGVGLHSYGFGGGGLGYVLAAAACDLIVLLFLSGRFKLRAPNKGTP